MLDEYVDELPDRCSRPETTVMPVRSRLKNYARLYANVSKTSNLLAPLLEESERSAEIDREFAAFDVLDEVLGTPAPKFKISRTLAGSPITPSTPVAPSTTRLTV